MVSFKTFGWGIVELFANCKMSPAYNDQCPPSLFWFDTGVVGVKCGIMDKTQIGMWSAHALN
jgi:hypothetical protein